ncbi:MAG: hypothetical protein C0501_31600 [Isosphaera sp.]|nr:hypothetical protein [Isosphaera sp.]
MTDGQAQKLDLIKRAVFGQLPDREWDTWVQVLSHVEIGVFKIVTGLRFFNKSGERLILSDADLQKVFDEVWGHISGGKATEFLKGHGFAVVEAETETKGGSSDSTIFSGRDCCAWARLRKKCAIGACLCWTTYGGWDCITPDRHGSRHGSCANAPVCTCKCDHYTDTHIINTVRA